MDKEIDAQEVIETPEEVVTETTEEETVESLTEKNKKLFARAKTAEGFELVEGAWVKKPKPEVQVVAPKESRDGLSNKDIIFLAKTDVHEEDLDELLEWAKFKKVGIAEAYDSMKDRLDKKQSLRKTAEATSTTTPRPASKKVTDDTILANLSKGEIPEPGSDEATRLFWAKRGGQKK